MKDRSAATRDASPISARLVICLGLSQLVGWGTMHYLIAVFGAPIRAELGWSAAFVQSGFSLALVTMGATSGFVGRWINRHGGRRAMMTGCWAGAAGCALLATSHAWPPYYLGWLLLGLGMRLALYDAAFASLAYLGGAASKRAMSQITLFGGLASTVFWPFGQLMSEQLGWRSALWIYALVLLMSSLLHRALPAGRVDVPGAPTPAGVASAPVSPVTFDQTTALFGFIAGGVIFMQIGMAAHFIELVRDLGWDAATAVTLASLFGLGQFSGRALVVVWAHRLNAVQLNLLPCGLLCGCFTIYLLAGNHLWAAAAFAFSYGCGNGIATITRGSMPLLLFDPAHYGRIVGAILRPAFMLAAIAPVAVALSIEHWGPERTVALALGLSIALLGTSVALWIQFSARQARQARDVQHVPAPASAPADQP